jgi:hypothetical protein
MSIDLSDYVDVSTRIARFYERFPDGRIQATPGEVVTIGDRVYVAGVAKVYRTADDATPCIAGAWEPWPGRTPYTKDSEAMNAETSAIGRALAAAGIEVRRSMASRDEVRSRQTDDVPMIAAKRKLLVAVNNDKARAVELWPAEWSGPVPKTELDALLAAVTS